jgi:NAD(P)-dependent dehydrogenase (short-subunit alcohol dehydrogenase family)
LVDVAAGAVVVVGGTSGLGLLLAESYAGRSHDVVITGRDADRCAGIAASIAGGGPVRPIAFDLAEPETIAAALEPVGPVEHLVLAAIERDYNHVLEYDVARAVRLVTLKLVGYSEVVHALAPRLVPGASILLFGGQALNRPYPGSTTVSTVNGGVAGLVGTLALQLAPTRVNAIHPGIVGDSPEWSSKPEVVERTAARTLIGRTVTMDEIVGAARFLLENTGVNGVNLVVDGGWTAT